MKDIHYKITFHSFWHIGSGEGKGADLDAVVLKENGLPYIPGKTLKGLFRDSATLVLDVKEIPNKDVIMSIFGSEGETTGEAYFSNAQLQVNLSSQISDTLKQHMYKKITSTAINSTTGIADDKSLRSIEVSIPLELNGRISNIADEYLTLMKETLQMTKYIGVGRNNGLGRCTIELIQEGKQ